MALETGTYVNSLVASNPASTDGLAQADDHIRLLKSTIKSTFPSVTGAVSSTHTELNALDGYTGTVADLNYAKALNATGVTAQEFDYLDGVTSSIQTQIAAIQVIPTGIIMLWSGASNAIPTGYALCNGSNSTPDLRNRFVIGAGSTYAVGATGGSADATNVSHTHLLIDSGDVNPLVTSNLSSSSSVAGETLGGTDFAYTLAAGNSSAANVGKSSTSTTGISVSNATVGSSATNANLPPYYSLCYIMKT
mgnify:CR=1 FL=1